MTKYEKLLIEAENQGTSVLELDLGTNKKCGKYITNTIIINSNMTDTEKFEILAEELGHHHTTFGHITNQNDVYNRKLELKARRDGYKILVDPIDIIEAIHHGAINIYEIADSVCVTVDTLYEIIEDFKKTVWCLDTSWKLLFATRTWYWCFKGFWWFIKL